MDEKTEKGVIENDGKTDHLGREFSPCLHLSGFSISGQSHYNNDHIIFSSDNLHTLSFHGPEFRVTFPVSLPSIESKVTRFKNRKEEKNHG